MIVERYAACGSTFDVMQFHPMARVGLRLVALRKVAWIRRGSWMVVPVGSLRCGDSIKKALRLAMAATVFCACGVSNHPTGRSAKPAVRA